jgi:hypothetical protein
MYLVEPLLKPILFQVHEVVIKYMFQIKKDNRQIAYGTMKRPIELYAGAIYSHLRTINQLDNGTA